MTNNNTWQRSQNLFLRHSEKSLSNFNAFSSACMVKLEARNSDSVIQQVYNDTVPVYNNFKQYYMEKDFNKSARIGKTITQKDKFNELTNEKIPKWEIAVLVLFSKKSAEYHTIFPMGRKAYNVGSYDFRIENLNTLVKTLSTFPQLSILYAEVKTFRDDLGNIRKIKKLKQEDVDNVGYELRNASNKLAVRLFRNLAILTDYYAETPGEIQRLFPMRYLRRINKTNTSDANILKINIAPDTVVEAGINFTNQSTMLIVNNSGANIKVWFAQSKDFDITANAIEILADDEAEIVVKNYAGFDDRFMMIANTSKSENAEVGLSLLSNA